MSSLSSALLCWGTPKISPCCPPAMSLHAPEGLTCTPWAGTALGVLPRRRRRRMKGSGGECWHRGDTAVPGCPLPPAAWPSLAVRSESWYRENMPRIPALSPGQFRLFHMKNAPAPRVRKNCGAEKLQAARAGPGHCGHYSRCQGHRGLSPCHCDQFQCHHDKCQCQWQVPVPLWAIPVSLRPPWQVPGALWAVLMSL